VSNRIQRLATDWKAYVAVVAGVASLLGAVTDLFTRLSQLSEGARQLPVETRWIAVALLAVVALIALLSALSRQSVLLRPERFGISADDPRFLVGRDDDLNGLIKACETSSLIFLIGESGAGKSALVKAGLLIHYRDDDKARLVPIFIDASSLSWEGDLRIELSRSLRSLSDSDREKIGDENSEIVDVFDRISRLPRDAASRLLLVFDQIDDYITVRREFFIRDRIVVARESIEKVNADWGIIAKLVRESAIQLLLVCRSDAAVTLDSLRFSRPVSVLLPRVDEQLIRPLLDRLTEDDGKGAVIEDPDYGWTQLKSRLLRDLSTGGGQVLPVQLAVALESLRRLRRSDRTGVLAGARRGVSPVLGRPPFGGLVCMGCWKMGRRKGTGVVLGEPGCA
jgi:energy-coupling factor transporter ATP-binding protein EcfA2